MSFIYNIVNFVQDISASIVSKKRKLSICEDVEQLQSKSIDSRTLVELCEEFESIEAIKKFVSDGGDVNVCNDKDQTSLHIACIHHRLDVVIFLLENGADINKVDGSGKDTLTIVFEDFRFQSIYDSSYHWMQEHTIMQVLVEHGANLPDNCDDYYIRAGTVGSVGLTTALFKRRAPYSSTKPLSFALKSACLKSNIALMHLLLQQGATFAEADIGFKFKHTCLYQKLLSDFAETFELANFILDNGLDIKNSYGVALLNTAIKDGKPDVVKYLLTRGVDIHTPDPDGHIPLFLSCTKSRIESFKLILAHGADVHLTDRDGNTPLVLASKGKKYNCVPPLLKACADVYAINNGGKCVLDFLKGNAAMLELCLGYGDRNSVSLKPLLK